MLSVWFIALLLLWKQTVSSLHHEESDVLIKEYEDFANMKLSDASSANPFGFEKHEVIKQMLQHQQNLLTEQAERNNKRILNKYNQCGSVELRYGGRINLKVALHNYCRLPKAKKKKMRAKLLSLKSFFKKVLETSRRFFFWDMVMNFSTGLGCSLPKFMKDSILVNATMMESRRQRYITRRRKRPSYKTKKKIPIIVFNVILPYTGNYMTSSRNTLRSVLFSSIHAVEIVNMCIMPKTMRIRNFRVNPCKSLKYRLQRKFRRLVPFTQLSNIKSVLSIDHHWIMSVLGCNPTYYNAVPIEHFDKNNKLHCKCKCAAGKEFQDPNARIRKCVKKPDHNKNGCIWKGKCFSIKTSGNMRNECKIKDSFGNGVNEIPYPWDNYVSLKLNNDKLAKITVTLDSPRKPLQKKITIPWKKFQLSRFDLLNKQLNFHTVGKHKLLIEAEDYSHKISCSAEIFVKDAIRPKGGPNAHCPKLIVGKDGGYPTYCLHTVNKLTKLANTFYEFQQSRVNDICGDGKSCDRYHNGLLKLGSSKSIVPVIEILNPWRIFSSEYRYLLSIKDTILKKAKPGCTQVKCYKEGIIFGENVKDYSCVGNPSKQECKDGGKCNYNQCVKVRGKDLFNVQVAIKPHVRKETTKVISSFPDYNYNNITEIHVSIKEVGVGTGVGQGIYKAKAKDLFDLKTFFKPIAKDKRVKLDELSVSDLVKCRFKSTSEEKWDSFHSESLMRFEEMESSIIIECWSAVGLVANYEFTMWVHPHSELQICGEFSRMVFYQTLSDPRRNESHEYCNIPGSDFGEITFDFARDIGRRTANGISIPFEFRNMTCNLNYIDYASDSKIGSGAQVLQFKGTKANRYIKRFSVGLINNPTDVKTMIEFQCHLVYQSLRGKWQKQDCEHRITFNDCDPPYWDHPFGECFKGGGMDKVRPNQVCAGNQISYASNGLKPGGVVYTEATKECYQGCEKYNMQCTAISGSDIKRCERKTRNKYLLALYDMKASPFVSTASLSGIGIALCVYIFVLRKKKQVKESDEDAFMYQKMAT